MGRLNIGTAGWSIPRPVASEFPAEGSALERYAERFTVTEINSSFHRPHRLTTWARWRDATPAGFRFSVKLPKAITHERRLTEFEEPLAQFLLQVDVLGDKLAVVLVQLPPKLAFDGLSAERFFRALASRTGAAIVCEPRHPSWFADETEAFLAGHRVARVAADPAICEQARHSGGWHGLGYWRLHGSPRIYRSSYGDRLARYADLLAAQAAAGVDAWCIFDNTASSAAAGDALALSQVLAQAGDPSAAVVGPP
jgi:uncharacterized protein YecE (DUF72 family)